LLVPLVSVPLLFPPSGRRDRPCAGNAHSSIGNICGKFIATAAMHQWGWSYAFICLGCVCAGVGLIQLLFVVPHPSDVLSPAELAELERINARGHVAKVAEAHAEGADAQQPYHTAFRINVPHAPVPNEVALVLASPPPPATAELLQPVGDHSAVDATRSSSVSSSPDAADGVAPQRHHDDFESISFAQALMVPGVLAYSACLFFSKLVSQPHSHNRLPTSVQQLSAYHADVTPRLHHPLASSTGCCSSRGWLSAPPDFNKTLLHMHRSQLTSGAITSNVILVAHSQSSPLPWPCSRSHFSWRQLSRPLRRPHPLVLGFEWESAASRVGDVPVRTPQ